MRQVMTLIEKQFGNNCEVVLSYPEKDKKSVIADIRNGHITNRHIGEEETNIGLEVLPGTMIDGDRFNYITTIRNGRIVRSSTIYLRDSSGNMICDLTINLDISDTLQLEDFLRQYNQFEQGVQKEAFAVSDVSGFLEKLIQNGLEKIGKSAKEMTKVEKVEFIRYLDEKGAFLITKSGEKICELLEISKFTFYSYLEKSRNLSEADEE